MRVVKIIGVVVGVLLLLIIGPLLLGIIAQSPFAMFGLIGLGLATVVLMWWRGMVSNPHRSWFLRSRSRQPKNVDDMRRQTAASQQRRHDGE
jgi:hypothetical protein